MNMYYEQEIAIFFKTWIFFLLQHNLASANGLDQHLNNSKQKN